MKDAHIRMYIFPIIRQKTGMPSFSGIAIKARGLSEARHLYGLLFPFQRDGLGFGVGRAPAIRDGPLRQGETTPQIGRWSLAEQGGAGRIGMGDFP